MSALWTVRIICDECDNGSEGVKANRAVYGATLDRLRADLARLGWTFIPGVATRPHRDWCPDCTQGRA